VTLATTKAAACDPRTKQQQQLSVNISSAISAILNKLKQIFKKEHFKKDNSI